MSDPVRIQLSRKKGWRMPENTVRVSRPGRWGNPFNVEICGRDLAIKAFRDLMNGCFRGRSFDALTAADFGAVYDAKERFLERHYGHPKHSAERELRGKNLACWCPIHRNGEPVPCHADVLLELANKP